MEGAGGGQRRNARKLYQRDKHLSRLFSRDWFLLFEILKSLKYSTLKTSTITRGVGGVVIKIFKDIWRKIRKGFRG